MMSDIVIVDDDRQMLDMYSEMLSPYGTISCFADPVVAFDRLMGVGDGIPIPCDLLVTDFHMPRMNGCELSRRIRSHRKVPVVMVSGCALDMSDIGHVKLFPKPFRMRDFTGYVRGVLSGSVSMGIVMDGAE